jgi:outer membrane receptor protein involved in Fe transport
LQVGYSRRIYRPRLWDLNPFFNIRNNFNIRTGNPNLQPEFTDSYEAGSIFIFNKISLNLIGYYRYTTDKIERVSTIEENVNTYRPENIGINKATGVEFNFKYTPLRKLTLNGDFNYNVFKRDGSFNDQTFNFSADKWTGKLTGKYKINKAIDVEISGRHESRERTVQGKLAENSSMDAGLKIKILNGKGVFNVSVRDIFSSRVRKNTIDNEDFYIYQRSQRGRFLTFSFSYGFGKGEAMQYSGRRHH